MRREPMKYGIACSRLVYGMILATICVSVSTGVVLSSTAAEESRDEIRILFADDFSNERVGTFPRRLEFLGGQADVVERGGKRLIRATTNKTWFKVPLAGILPEQFTIELDLMTPEGLNGLTITTSETRSNTAYYDHPFLQIGHRHGSGVAAGKQKTVETQLEDEPRFHEALLPVRITVDGDHVRLFVDGSLLNEIEGVEMPRTDALWFLVPRAGEKKPLFLGNLRVAAGIVDLPDAIDATGGIEVADETEDEGGPDLGVWDNYNFVTGDEILFSEDYADDAVGTFPSRLEMLGGTAEIVELDGKKVLRVSERKTWFKIPLPKDLPERFTLEVEVMAPKGLNGIAITTSETKRNPGAYYESPYFQIGHRAGTGVTSSRPKYGPKSVSREPKLHEGLLPVRIMVDDDYVQMFVEERRVANVPNAEMPRTDELWVVVPRTSEKKPVYIGEIRVAGGGQELYDALLADGRVATRGILFDTNSAEIRPESAPVLKEIGSMMRDHPKLRIRIEGHTDSVGDDASNQRLSERRAAAVRSWLIQNYGIEESRLESVGRGESEPVASNDTAEGRQMNRRVELVRL